MPEQQMLRDLDTNQVINHLIPRLLRGVDRRPVVLMTCGIAGSGKTTLAKEICSIFSSYRRLSNDEIIAAKHGICGVDYDVEKYDEYQDEADRICMQSLKEILETYKGNVVLDRSLYAKGDRDEFKTLIESYGARWILVYFKVEKELLWRRICERREKEVNANSALDISRELFERYVEAFEHPSGEGEIVVEYTE